MNSAVNVDLNTLMCMQAGDFEGLEELVQFNEDPQLICVQHDSSSRVRYKNTKLEHLWPA